MKRERSYGIIPLRFQEGQWMVLLVQHQAGHWSFPKGHANPEESPQQAAERELFEETGLTVQHYLSPVPLTEMYHFSFQKQLIHKSVDYYLALVEGQVVIQELEIRTSEWLMLSEAYARMTFKEGKRICQEVMNIRSLA
jgi:bis(5'-nucleosidyl)-tetraphosphatase